MPEDKNSSITIARSKKPYAIECPIFILEDIVQMKNPIIY